MKVVNRNGGNGETAKCSFPKPINSVAFLAEQSMVLEKARVASQVRLAHLAKHGRKDEETEEVLRRIKSVEDFVDDLLKKRTDDHLAAAWLKKIPGCVTTKGILTEPVCKLLGIVDSFGRFYPEGDIWIPGYVEREPEVDEAGQAWIWVEGIERLATPSKLWKFAALSPDSKRQKGKLNTGSTQLKTILFRVMKLFMYSRNRYYDHYVDYKEWKRVQLVKAGIKVRPTPAGRYCSVCEKELKLKAGFYCPDCGEKLSKKEEPQGVLWEGHLDFMARRHTLKLFLSHFWLVYRQALNLPVRAPYPVEHLEGHTTIIDLWEMAGNGRKKEQAAA